MFHLFLILIENCTQKSCTCSDITAECTTKGRPTEIGETLTREWYWPIARPVSFSACITSSPLPRNQPPPKCTWKSPFFILNLNSTESPLWILMNYTATKISRQSPLYKIRYSFVLFRFVLFCFQEKELTFCGYKMCVIFSGYCGESFWPLSGHSLPLDRLFYPHWKPIGSRHRPTSSPLIRAKIQMKLKGLQLNSFVYVKKKSKI